MDAVMARHFEAEAAHDRAGILATLTEDAEHEPVGFPGAPFHSHDELMGFYEVLFEELEQLDITPVRRLHGHNFLVDEIQYGGRAYNGFMGFEFGPEGKPVDFRLLHVCELGLPRGEVTVVSQAAVAVCGVMMVSYSMGVNRPRRAWRRRRW